MKIKQYTYIQKNKRLYDLNRIKLTNFLKYGLSNWHGGCE